MRLKQRSSLGATWKTRTSELGKQSTVTRGRERGGEREKHPLTRLWFCVFAEPHLWESALCYGCDLFGGG